MKPRPPSFRLKKRYILAQIHPPWSVLEGRALASAVSEAATELWGDAKTAWMQPSVVYQEEDRVILRCRRGTEGDLVTALVTIAAIGDRALCLRPVAVSGTMRALKERGAYLHLELQEENRTLQGSEFRAYRYQGHKLDLIEKGIKGQNVVFFTEDDIEEL